MDKEDKKQIVGMFEHISEKMIEGFEEIHSKMATKEDLERFATKEDFGKLELKMESGFREVRSDIRSLRTDLDAVEQTTESNKGFA